MRIYANFREAMSELKRDLKEMGIKVHTDTYQDKFIGDDPEMETLELQNYLFTVTDPRLEDLSPTQPWADAEFEARINFSPKLNPGEAWELRPEVWTQFREKSGKFSYTYPERIHNNRQIDIICRQIMTDPNSRQLYLSIWDPNLDADRIGGVRRVPCTLGYLFQVRDGQLNITYLLRSSDLATHLQNDIYLAARLQQHIAHKTGYPVGTYTHWFGSLHVFSKDVQGVF